MFERFTYRLRKVVVLAQEEASHYGHNYIGSEHLLLGLLRNKKEYGLGVFLDVTFDQVDKQVASTIGYGVEWASGNKTFTPQAKKVLELALRDMLRLGHLYVDVEHLAYALTNEPGGAAARILREISPQRGLTWPLRSWLRYRLTLWRHYARLRRSLRRSHAQRSTNVPTLAEFLEKKNAQKREAYDARLAEQRQQAN